MRAAKKSQSAVLDALRTGSFYGSTGPRIDAVELTDGDVTVRCSPAASVTLYTGRARGARVNAGRLGYPCSAEILERDESGLITAARLERPVRQPYGRVEVAASDGTKAWTNPLWIA